jgi:hypothetical protein
VELVHNRLKKVIVSMVNYDENPSDLEITNKNGYIVINSKKIDLINQINMNKFCVESPNFSSYKVSVPYNSEVEIYYNNGNFLTNDFKGRLKLRLNKGNIEISKFVGDLNIELFSGNVSLEIVDSVIDITSNRGKINSDFKLNKSKKSNNSLIGLYGKPFNKLYLKSVYANIDLSTSKTQ